MLERTRQSTPRHLIIMIKRGVELCVYLHARQEDEDVPRPLRGHDVQHRLHRRLDVVDARLWPRRANTRRRTRRHIKGGYTATKKENR